jgi:hypothetical protein
MEVHSAVQLWSRNSYNQKENRAIKINIFLREIPFRHLLNKSPYFEKINSQFKS